jgi:hypothetical protein
LLEGDDDAVVRVDETRLDGAGDFLVVPVHHAAMMHDPAVRERMLKIGAEPKPGTPAEFSAMIHGEIAKWGEVVRRANIRMGD